MDKCKYYHTHTWGEPPLEPGENGTIETEFQCKKMNNREVSCCGDLELCELPNWKDELKKRWYLHTRKEGQQPYKAELSFTTCEEEVIDFIESLLKKQREDADIIIVLCKQKLRLYRESGTGEYLGGVEYTELMKRIEEYFNAPEPGEK